MGKGGLELAKDDTNENSIATIMCYGKANKTAPLLLLDNKTTLYPRYD